MRIFDKISRLINKKKTPEQPKDDLSVITNSSGQKMLVDKAYTEYLESTAPDPTQASLDKTLHKVASIRVIDGGMQGTQPLGEKVLLQTSDAKIIEEFRQTMQISDGSNGHCMCYGDPTIELLSSRNKRIALIGVHHGESIRWDSWKHDAKLVDGESLLLWLDQQGVHDPLTDYQKRQEEHNKALQDWNQWIMAMPVCLRELPQESWALIFENKNLSPAMQAMANVYPDKSKQIATLLYWFANGKGSWSSFPAYELVAEKMLLQYTIDDLTASVMLNHQDIKVLKENTDSQVALNFDDHIRLIALHRKILEGAARLFSGSAFQKYSDKQVVDPVKEISFGLTGMVVFVPPRSEEKAAIPEALKQQLLEFFANVHDEEKRDIVKSAFG